MTTFTLKDYLENRMVEEKDKSITINLEPTMFSNVVITMQDRDDTITMLREQLHSLNEELNRLKGLLMKHGISH